MAKGTGLLRAARTFTLVIAVSDFGVCVVDATARGHFATAAGGAAISGVFLAGGAIGFTAAIRSREAADAAVAVQHPDWPAIRRMELEVWGETFTHAGAPAVPVQGATVSTARAWHPDEGACAGCGIVLAAFHYRGSATGARWCPGCARQRTTFAFAKAVDDYFIAVLPDGMWTMADYEAYMVTASRSDPGGIHLTRAIAAGKLTDLGIAAPKRLRSATFAEASQRMSENMAAIVLPGAITALTASFADAIAAISSSVPDLDGTIGKQQRERHVCGHGDRFPAPCGDVRWCMEDAGHSTPHTGQTVRCTCGMPGGWQ